MVTVTLLSCHDVLFEGQAQHVVLPGEQGVFEVWPFHHPLVSRLLPGVIVVDERLFPIRRGVVHVTHSAVKALIEPEQASE